MSVLAYQTQMDLAIEAEVVEQKKDPCCGGAGYFLAITGLFLVMVAIVLGPGVVDDIREANSPPPTLFPTSYPTTRCLYPEFDDVTSETGDYVVLRFIYLPERLCPTEAFYEAFLNAAARLSKIVKGSVNYRGDENMRLTISIKEMTDPDAPYSIFTNFTTQLLTTERLPTSSTLDIDVGFALEMEAAGLLNDVALHEMVHALGFGNSWSTLDEDDLAIFDRNVNTSLVPYYIGEYANAAYQTLGGYDENTTIPLQHYNNSGDVANYNSFISNAIRHWDEQVFGNELMTYDMKPGEAHPLSIITIEALRDQGYVVDPSLADDYTLPVLDN